MDNVYQNQKSKKIFLVASEPQVILKVKRRKVEAPADKIIAECDSNYIPKKVKKADTLDEISLNVESLHVSNNPKFFNQINNNRIFSRIINEEEKKGILENPNKINIAFGDEVRVITNPEFTKKKRSNRGMKKDFRQKNKEERIEQEYKRHKKELNNFIKSKRRQMEIFEEKLANIEKRKVEKLAKQKKEEEEKLQFKKINQIALMY